MKSQITFFFVLLLLPIVTTSQYIGTGLGFYTIVAKSDGTVYTWGANFCGQLGNGMFTNSSVPVAVSTSGVLSGKTITKVATGGEHSIALASDGTVYTWGSNYFGQLGNGTNGDGTDSNVPVAVVTSGTPMAGKIITQVAAGADHSIALASDGTVYTWGFNYHEQLGNGNNTDSNVPVAVVTSGTPMAGKTIIQVAAGTHHCIVLASDGTVYTWGENSNGQLGNGNNTNSNVPVAVVTNGVLSGKTITQVAAGSDHSIALASDGTVYTWGRNSNGQLGNGTSGDGTDSNVPVTVVTNGVLSGKTITQVAAGAFHCIVLASDGTVYTWGRNSNGQLGNGTSGDGTDSNVPVAVVTNGVLSGKTITRVAGGYYHSIVLASDGTVYTWGRNYNGQLGIGTSGDGTDSNVPVAVDQSVMGPLPVELTFFTAASTTSTGSANIVLNWQTATEVNNYGFEILRRFTPQNDSHSERSEESNWQIIGFVAGHGNSNSPKNYEFTDSELPNSDVVSYRLKQIDIDGNYEYSDVVEVKLAEIVKEYSLSQNYPNPFNPSTVISYSIPVNVKSETSNVKLVVYDILGNEVADLVNERQKSGNYEVKFNASNLSSGVYFYKLISGDFSETKKMLLMK